MGRLKSELSDKNEDKISKHRYYELQHHCMQYAEWKRLSDDLLTKSPYLMAEKVGKTNDISDPTSYVAERREKLLIKINRVKKLCECAGGESAYYLMACVTNGYSYDVLQAKYGVLPCSRVEFYKKYRRFFKMLDMEI